MGRCEICGRKIPGNRRFCGAKDCVNKGDIIPRCIKCGNLMFQGMEPCPVDRQLCIPDNTEVTIKTKAEYLEAVS